MSRHNKERRARKRDQKEREIRQQQQRFERLSLDVLSFHPSRWRMENHHLRSCGGCTVCCTMLGVEALGKPPACRCQHEVEGGCGIYEERPQDCRNYLCLWRQGGGSDEDRPDRSGVMITWGFTNDPDDKRVGNVDFVEVRPGALKSLWTPQRSRRLWEILTAYCLEHLPNTKIRLRFIPFGASRSSNIQVVESYRSHPVINGQDFEVGTDWARTHIGVIVENGKLRMADGREWERESWQEAIAEMLGSIQ